MVNSQFSKQKIQKPHKKLNWLRAAVLGANDGIVSISGLVAGVAGATESTQAIFTAGVAGVTAGAIAMAAGEYVSVSSQRDSEKAMLKRQHHQLKNDTNDSLQQELALIYQEKGLAPATAKKVAAELSQNDPLRAHAEVKFGIDPDELTNPLHAAVASAAAFIAGAVVPMLAIILPPASFRMPVAFGSVLLALVIAGVVGAKVGNSSVAKSTTRVVVGGVFAMVVTYGIGKLFNVAVG